MGATFGGETIDAGFLAIISRRHASSSRPAQDPCARRTVCADNRRPSLPPLFSNVAGHVATLAGRSFWKGWRRSRDDRRSISRL